MKRFEENSAELDAGWLNFGINGADKALESMQQAWLDAGRAPNELKSNLFFLGAVLTGDEAEDEAKLMAQGGPLTAVMFHNLEMRRI